MAQSEGSKGYSDTQKNGCLNFVHLAILTRQPNVGTGMSLLGGHLHNFLLSLLLCWTFLLWITHLVLHVTMNHPADGLATSLSDASRKVNRSKTIPKWRNSPIKGTNPWFSWFEASHRPTVPPPTVLESQAANLCWVNAC